jgi:PKD domain
MRRYWFLAVLTVLLSACGVLAPTATVTVTPSPIILGTGDTQTLTASLSSGTAQDFTWTIKTGDGTLSSIRGSTITYTAPSNVGEYTITVSAVGVEATNAVVNISVLNKLLANPNASVAVNGADRTLISGQTKRFVVDIPSQPPLGEPLLYFELGTAPADNTAVTLTVKDSNQSVVGVSNTPRFFTRSATTGSALEAQAITVNQICRGACVIIRNPGAGRYFLELTATKDVSFDLFVFDDPFTDNLEPNDSTCTQATTVPNSTFEGAIETLGDIDCYQTTVNVPSVTLSLTATTAIPIRAEVRAASNDELIQSVTITPGGQNQVVSVTPPRPVKVIVTSPDRAGPSGSSKYGLNIVLNP